MQKDQKRDVSVKDAFKMLLSSGCVAAGVASKPLMTGTDPSWQGREHQCEDSNQSSIQLMQFRPMEEYGGAPHSNEALKRITTVD